MNETQELIVNEIKEIKYKLKDIIDDLSYLAKQDQDTKDFAYEKIIDKLKSITSSEYGFYGLGLDDWVEKLQE